MLLKYNILYFYKKDAEMTSNEVNMLDRVSSLWLSGNNCLEALESLETRDISFCQICKHPE